MATHHATLSAQAPAEVREEVENCLHCKGKIREDDSKVLVGPKPYHYFCYQTHLARLAEIF